MEFENENPIEIQPKGSYFQTDAEGYLLNPTSKEKIQEEWKPVIDDAVEAYKQVFGDKLKAVYVRGSIAKGEAVKNVSDVDTFAYVDLPADEISHSWAESYRTDLEQKYPFATGIEMGADPLSDTSKQNDQIFLMQSVCVYGTPVEIEKRKSSKNMFVHFPMSEKRIKNFEERLSTIDDPEEVKKGCTWMMKNILRTGFELTMERSHKYTRDLYLCYEGFSEYYPEYQVQMREVLNLALNPTSDKEKVIATVQAIAPWMSVECAKLN